MTPRQREFAQLYAQGGSIKEAARGAGYSNKYADGNAHQLLNKPDVIAEIKRFRERLNQTADKSATDVVNEYAKIAFTDRVGFLKEDEYNPGEFVYKSPDELTQEQRDIVEDVSYTLHEVTVIRDGQVEKVWVKNYRYKLAEKAGALQQMGRHFGIFDDKLKLTTGGQNTFKNATQEQLKQLKQSFVGIMHQPAAVEGEYKEVKK